MKELLVVIGLALLLPAGLSAGPVVFALKPDKDPDAMLAERESLQAFALEKLGREVSVVVPLSGSVIQEGFANGTIDLAFISAADMVLARNRGTAEILLAGEIHGNPWYESYWVVRADSPYQSVADLAGKPVAFASRTSTSGFVIPYWDLVRKELLSRGQPPEEFFGKRNVYYGTGYVSAIERLLGGDAEAAAVSYYVLDQDKHLNPGQKARLRKLTSQGPVPTHVLAVRASLEPAAKDALRGLFFSLNDTENTELRDRLFTSKLVEVDSDAHLEGIEEAMDLVLALP